MTPSLDANKALYRAYIDALNQQDFDTIRQRIAHLEYHEICVGFTPGRVAWSEAEQSLRRVLRGIPDLRAEIEEIAAEGNKVFAKLLVTGTQSGWLFGAPPTGRTYAVSMFDYVEIEDGRIRERVQQADNLGQMTQLFGPVLKGIGLGLGALLVGTVVYAALR
jgi:predicted ester cyclase